MQRQRRNPKYFDGLARKALDAARTHWAAGDEQQAHDTFTLAVQAYRQAAAFGLRPHSRTALTGVAVAIIAGDRQLARELAAADGGLQVQGDDREWHTSTEQPVSHEVRTLVALAEEDDAANAELAALTGTVDTPACAGDRALLGLHSRMLDAVLQGDGAALSHALDEQYGRIVAQLARSDHPEASDDLVDWFSTAVLAIALRRGMRVPDVAPTFPVPVIAADWTD